VQSENLEALVQMVVSTPEDTDEKTRFKYVYILYIAFLVTVEADFVIEDLDTAQSLH